MKCEKPVTINIKQKANAIWKYLYSNRRFCTKGKLMQASGCTNERSVRDIINLLRNMGYCIVSVWTETDKRVQELESMKSCFVNFYERMRCSNG